MTWKQKTVDTYNKSAKELAEYFRGIGSRKGDIQRAIELSDATENPVILEIGCGDGRDAKEVVKFTDNYKGFDISEELIKLANEHVPTGEFEVADAVGYNFQKGLDIVLAFASLLHLDKNEVKDVLDKAHEARNPGGVFFISLKYRPSYQEEVKKDKFGERMFYYYNPDFIKGLAGENYEVVYKDGGFITTGNTEWFEVGLKKL